MPGLIPVFRKELADHFSSKRFVILFALVMISGSARYVAAAVHPRGSLRAANATVVRVPAPFTASNGYLPAFVTFIGFLGPLVGLALGFDAINGEQARGTLSRLLAQPIYRDSVINGKFLAGLLPSRSCSSATRCWPLRARHSARGAAAGRRRRAARAVPGPQRDLRGLLDGGRDLLLDRLSADGYRRAGRMALWIRLRLFCRACWPARRPTSWRPAQAAPASAARSSQRRAQPRFARISPTAALPRRRAP